MNLTRPIILFVLFGVGAGAGLVAPDFAAAQPFPPHLPGRGWGVGPRPPVIAPRAPVVVHPGRKLHRPPRAVIVRPPKGIVRPHVEPRVFLPPVVFGGAVVGYRHERRYRYDDDRGRRGYSRERLVWQDSETLYREDEWTEFTFDCNTRGSKIWFEVLEGRVKADWAEVVFENGEVQVVEFPEDSLGRGIYELLDFRQSRRVDSVRMVAQTPNRVARLTLWMER